MAIATTAILSQLSNASNYTIFIPLSEKAEINYGLSVKPSWIPADSSYGAWENTGEVYDCQSWLPDLNNYRAGDSVNQTSNNCKRDQSRLITLMERDINTDALRIAGTTTENQTISATNTRTALGTGTKGTYCFYQTSQPTSFVSMTTRPTGTSSSSMYYDYILYYEGKQVGTYTGQSSNDLSYKTTVDGKKFSIGKGKSYVYRSPMVLGSATYEICYQ